MGLAIPSFVSPTSPPDLQRLFAYWRIRYLSDKPRTFSSRFQLVWFPNRSPACSISLAAAPRLCLRPYIRWPARLHLSPFVPDFIWSSPPSFSFPTCLLSLTSSCSRPAIWRTSTCKTDCASCSVLGSSIEFCIWGRCTWGRLCGRPRISEASSWPRWQSIGTAQPNSLGAVPQKLSYSKSLILVFGLAQEGLLAGPSQRHRLHPLPRLHSGRWWPAFRQSFSQLGSCIARWCSFYYNLGAREWNMEEEVN